MTEDSDWLCMDTSVPEEEGLESLLVACEVGEQEGGQGEAREKQEEVKLAINGNRGEEIDSRNNSKEVKLEEEKKKEYLEKRVSFAEGPVIETVEQREDEGLKEKRENQSKGVVGGHEMEKGTNEMQRDVARVEEGKEKMEEQSKEATESLNKLIKLNPQCEHPDIVEEQQGQEETPSLKTAASPGPRHLAADLTPPACQEKRGEEVVKKEEREMRQTPSPPKVLSTVARFQPQGPSQGFQVKSRTMGLAEPERPCSKFRSRENAQTHPSRDSNIPSEANSCSEAHEDEDPPPVIKVSELKKRFEA